jgi:hypothetical protein
MPVAGTRYRAEAVRCGPGGCVAVAPGLLQRSQSPHFAKAATASILLRREAAWPGLPGPWRTLGEGPELGAGPAAGLVREPIAYNKGVIIESSLA